MLKVVLDTNIFVSGILFGGNARTILNLIIQGKLRLFVSEEILAELSDVLRRKKFDFPLENIRHILYEIELISEFITPEIHHEITAKDPDDNMIIDCAVAAQADYIVSGDSDLLELVTFQKIGIVSPNDFLKKIL